MPAGSFYLPNDLAEHTEDHGHARSADQVAAEAVTHIGGTHRQVYRAAVPSRSALQQRP